MCNSPYSPRASARTFSTDSSARFSKSRTSSRKSFPSAVSVTPRELRRRRSTPISSSRSWICRLNAGCATRSRAAALVKFNASPTARKYRRCRSSIAQFHHAEKAWQHNKHGIGRTQNAHRPFLKPNTEGSTMKNNVIDIIQRFQTRHALEEERELKDFHASGNGAVAPSIPDKNSTPENTDKDIDINRSRPNETTRDMEFSTPHLERIVRTVRGLPATAKV